MSKLSSPRIWLHGLGAALISAASDAVLAYGLLPGVDWHEFAKVVAIKAIIAVALYLKQSPLPGRQPDPPEMLD